MGDEGQEGDAGERIDDIGRGHLRPHLASGHGRVEPVGQPAGQHVVETLELMLSAFVRDRDVIGPDRSMDIRFDDFMADEAGVAARVYELAGEPLTGDARAAIDAYLSEHQRGRLGRVALSPEMFGLDEGDLRARFAPYTQRFLT